MLALDKYLYRSRILNNYVNTMYVTEWYEDPALARVFGINKAYSVIKKYTDHFGPDNNNCNVIDIYLEMLNKDGVFIGSKDRVPQIYAEMAVSLSTPGDKLKIRDTIGNINGCVQLDSSYFSEYRIQIENYKHMSKYCAKCKACNTKLFYCGDCRSVSYCSKVCQKLHRRSHRSHCKQVKKL
jgi:hypothetical protein